MEKSHGTRPQVDDPGDRLGWDQSAGSRYQGPEIWCGPGRVHRRQGL